MSLDKTFNPMWPEKQLAAYNKMFSALEKATLELTTIRARDRVPYTYNGWKSGVSEDYFSSVVDECFSAIDDAKVFIS